MGSYCQIWCTGGCSCDGSAVLGDLNAVLQLGSLNDLREVAEATQPAPGFLRAPAHLVDPIGRVAAGSYPPAAPTDPDVPNSGIRLLKLCLRCNTHVALLRRCVLMASWPNVPAICPSGSSTARSSASLHRVPSGQVPRLLRYYRRLRLLASPRASLRLLHSGLPPLAPPFATTRRDALPVDPDHFSPRRPRRLCTVEKTRPPRFPDDPCVHAPLFDPGGAPAPGPFGTGDGVFRHANGVDSAKMILSELNHAACTLPEPPRVSRRLHLSSHREERADELIDKILSGSPGSSSAAGAGATGSTRLSVLCDPLGGVEAQVYGGLDFGIVDTSSPKGQVSTKSVQLHF